MEPTTAEKAIKTAKWAAKRYGARDVVLAKWVKGSKVEFYRLKRNASDPKTARGKDVNPGELFR